MGQYGLMGGTFIVSCPDPTLPERKRVWLQYDILPDPVTLAIWHVK